MTTKDIKRREKDGERQAAKNKNAVKNMRTIYSQKVKNQIFIIDDETYFYLDYIFINDSSYLKSTPTIIKYQLKNSKKNCCFNFLTK